MGWIFEVVCPCEHFREATLLSADFQPDLNEETLLDFYKKLDEYYDTLTWMRVTTWLNVKVSKVTRRTGRWKSVLPYIDSNHWRKNYHDTMNDPSSLRPQMLLPIMTKGLEHLDKRRIIISVDHDQLHQFGFIKDNGTQEAIDSLLTEKKDKEINDGYGRICPSCEVKPTIPTSVGCETNPDSITTEQQLPRKLETRSTQTREWKDGRDYVEKGLSTYDQWSSIKLMEWEEDLFTNTTIKVGNPIQTDAATVKVVMVELNYPKSIQTISYRVSSVSSETSLANTSKPRIEHGYDCAPRQYPFLVKVTLVKDATDYSFFIGSGTLISPKWVLTSAVPACLKEMADEIFGSLGIKIPKSCNIKIHSASEDIDWVSLVSKTYTHPKFSVNKKDLKFENDIALFELMKEVPKTYNLKFIALPESSTFNPDCTEGLIMGWGSNEIELPVDWKGINMGDLKGINMGDILKVVQEFQNIFSQLSSSDKLKCGKVPLISDPTCSKMLTDANADPLNSDQMCSFSKSSEKKPNPGLRDYGGPLICGDVQIGIITVSPKKIKNFFLSSGTDAPRTYTKVSSHLDFIHATMSGSVNLISFSFPSRIRNSKKLMIEVAQDEKDRIEKFQVLDIVKENCLSAFSFIELSNKT
ncbi:unnamed protein product [Ceutorhynchus assimilis]|uniref:Peptidase S1 domain-containing protein n=1 Tax=Ceutorhynchus assimilis TaxID=467358 RepID=A0A9N9QRS1_9CUCU|nr:unnamed protein product [Ceutorhynchus assimilis]